MITFKSSKPKEVHQAAAIPFRCNDGRVEYCLITSSAGRWMFPKGFVDEDETYGEAALKEAFEEAGLHGEIVDEPLGWYEINKDEKSLTVVAMLMQVVQADKEWEESDKRDRRWVSRKKAHELLTEPDLRELLDLASARIKRAA